MKTVNGMTKEEYVQWRMDAYECNEYEANIAWNKATKEVVELTDDEKFEHMRNAMLY